MLSDSSSYLITKFLIPWPLKLSSSGARNNCCFLLFSIRALFRFLLMVVLSLSFSSSSFISVFAMLAFSFLLIYQLFVSGYGPKSMNTLFNGRFSIFVLNLIFCSNDFRISGSIFINNFLTLNFFKSIR